MCADCRAEYDNPADRRFHAQPNACQVCGPSVRLLGDVAADDAVTATATALKAGAIVAIKGIGGYHLACLAASERTVAGLRARKHREDKPFALMAPSLTAVESLVSLSSLSLGLLTSPARPIVLAPRLADAPVADSVAPGAPELGVMLPYSPLHHLLLADVGETLVMTSANVSDEPIAFVDDDALERLRGIADLFLIHDRPIQTRTDDSVVRAVPRPTILRRSRGYVPAALSLPGGGTPRPLLACGAELKNTFCLARGSRAWVSHHIGDLENYETLRSFTDGIEHFGALFAVEPEVVAHDLHPEYLSTKYALDLDGVELIGVQHHHAHLAACLAEHDETGPALGAIFDGTGYGLDGTVWGGELLFGGVRSCERVGSLLPVALPGGERAIRQPWRMACSWLSRALDGDEPRLPASLARRVEPRAWSQVHRLAAGGGPAAPATTSIGRLFDAVAALAGIRADINYEGQAAIELEAACDPGERGSYPIAVHAADDRARYRSPGDDPRGPRRRYRRRVRRRHRASVSPHDRARHRGRVRGARRCARDGGSGALRRRVPEPPAARVGVGRARRRRIARARTRAAPGQRRWDRVRPGCRRGGIAGMSDLDRILEQQVYIDGANRPFGSLTPDHVRARADELRAAVGWGPTARVAPVALAWRELSVEMDRAGAATVGALDPEVLVKLAPRLWVTLPG